MQLMNHETSSSLSSNSSSKFESFEEALDHHFPIRSFKTQIYTHYSKTVHLSFICERIRETVINDQTEKIRIFKIPDSHFRLSQKSVF